jgi:hypothetical protein
VTASTGHIDDTFLRIELEISLIEPGQKDLVEVHRPDAICGLLEADEFLEQRIAEKELVLFEPEGAGVADPPSLEVPWVLWGRQLLRHPSLGGLVERSGSLLTGGFVRALLVVLGTEAVEACLLSGLVLLRRAGGVGLQGALQARVAAILVRWAGFDARRYEAQAPPPGGHLRPHCQGVGGARHAGVGAAAPRQTACREHARADGCGLRHAGGSEGLAREPAAAVAGGDRQWRAVAAIPGLDVACESRAPDLLDSRNRRGKPSLCDSVSRLSKPGVPIGEEG